MRSPVKVTPVTYRFSAPPYHRDSALHCPRAWPQTEPLAR